MQLTSPFIVNYATSFTINMNVRLQKCKVMQFELRKCLEIDVKKTVSYLLLNLLMWNY